MSKPCRRFLWMALWISVVIGLPGMAYSAYGPRLYVDIHPQGWISSKAVCVNGRGQTVGNGMTPQGERGFLWTAGQYSVLLPAGATSSRVSWVNDRGDIAGTAFDADGVPHAFLFRNGGYTDPTPGWRYSEALFVGEDGAVTGRGDRGGFVSIGGVVSIPPTFSSIVGITSTGTLFGSGDNVARMFIPGKGYLSLLPPGEETASPGRMNENGLAAFSARYRGVEKGYVFSGGFMIFMIPPEWTSSVAESINNLGEVAGYGEGPQGRQGFLRSGSDYEVISCPDCMATEVKSVNDFGEVAGSGETASGANHAFFSYPASVSAPVSQPSTVGGMSAAGGCSMASSQGQTAPEAGIADLLFLLCPPGYFVARRAVRRSVTPR
jgi:probable HAF family extracellular repeat protein